MNQIYMLAHYVDVDGIISHAIIERAFPEQVEHINLDYPNYREDLEKLLDKEPGRVIIADLGHNQVVEECLPLFEKLSASHNSLEYYDHHKWPSAEHFEQHINPFIIDTAKSSANILQEIFLPNDILGKHLGDLGYTADRIQNSLEGKYELLKPHAKLLQDVISFSVYFPAIMDPKLEPEEIIKELSNGIISNQRFIEAVDLYKNIKQKKLDELLAHQKTISTEQATYSISFAHPCLYMGTAGRYLNDKLDIDFSVTVFPTGSVLLLKKSGQCDVTRMAKDLFKGGGRETGDYSGANLDPREYNIPTYTKKADTSLMYDKVTSKINNYLVSL